MNGARFVADGRGVALVLGASVRTCDELHELAEAASALAKCVDGASVVAVEDPEDGLGVGAPDAGRALIEKRLGDRSVLSLADRAGVADALEAAGAHVWRVKGAEGIFASNFAPAWDARLAPVSKHADFPKPRARHATLIKLRKDEASAPAAAADEQIVYGIVLEPETTDSQGDIYSAREIEIAAHKYLEDKQILGHMHETELPDDSVRVIESYVAPCTFTMGEQEVKAGTWVIAAHVTNAALWQQIKDGDLTGFSIGGWAQRVPQTPAAA